MKSLEICESADEPTDRTPLLFTQEHSTVLELTGRSTNRQEEGTSSSWSHKFLLVCILFVEGAERLSYYTVTGNMLFLLTTCLGLDDVTAVNIQLAFIGVTYLCPLFAGYLADTYFGKYRIITISAVFYCFSMVMLTAMTDDFGVSKVGEFSLPLHVRRGLAIPGFLLLCITTGGLKACVAPFGAEQLKSAGDSMLRSYYMWHFWFINLTPLVSYTVMAYVQQEIGFFYTLIVCTLISILSFIAFIIHRKRFYISQVTESTMSTVFKVVGCAMSRRCCCRRSRSSSSSSLSTASMGLKRPRAFLDYACEDHGGRFDRNTVDDVSQCLRLAGIYMLYTCYFTMQFRATFLLQGQGFNFKIGKHLSAPIASLNAVFVLSVTGLIPLSDKVIFPIIIRCGGKVPRPLGRSVIGFLALAVSSLIAALLEIYRKSDIENNGAIEQVAFGVTHMSSSISVFIQVPQYVCASVGDVYAWAAANELAFTDAPPHMRSIMHGWFNANMGFGAFFSSLVLFLGNSLSKEPWVLDNINTGHLEYLFLVFIVVLLLGALGLILQARTYVYVSDRPKKRSAKA